MPTSRVVINLTMVLLTVGLLALVGIVATTVWLAEKAQIYAEDATGARNTRIAAVELRAALQSAESSQRGYLVGGGEALERHRIKVDPLLMLEARPGLVSGGKALVRLVEGHRKVDAVFLTGDVLPTGALLEANRRGCKVPDHIAIAGSDDDELQENVSPPLTSIRFPRYEIGHRAACMVMDRVVGRSCDSAILDLGFEIISASTKVR